MGRLRSPQESTHLFYLSLTPAPPFSSTRFKYPKSSSFLWDKPTPHLPLAFQLHFNQSHIPWIVFPSRAAYWYCALIPCPAPLLHRIQEVPVPPRTHVIFSAPSTCFKRPLHSRIPGSTPFWSLWLDFNYTVHKEDSASVCPPNWADSLIYSPSPTKGRFFFVISAQQFLQYFRKGRFFSSALFSSHTLHKESFKFSK